MKRLLKKMLPKSDIVYMKEKKKKKEDTTESAVQSDAPELPMEDDEKDKLELLEERGFHTRAGLQHCGGDSEFYEKLLAQFAKDSEGKITNIEASFEKEDIKNYQIMVHALKSSSKMVGENTLSEMAKKAEEAAKDKDVVYIRENHEKLIDKYRETVQCILDVLGLAEESSQEEVSENGTEISKDEMFDYLSKLKQSLETFEADKAEALLAEMNGFLYREKSARELLREIRQDVEDFELDAAAEKVGELIHSMEGGEA